MDAGTARSGATAGAKAHDMPTTSREGSSVAGQTLQNANGSVCDGVIDDDTIEVACDMAHELAANGASLLTLVDAQRNPTLAYSCGLDDDVVDEMAAQPGVLAALIGNRDSGQSAESPAEPREKDGTRMAPLLPLINDQLGGARRGALRSEDHWIAATPNIWAVITVLWREDSEALVANQRAALRGLLRRLEPDLKRTLALRSARIIGLDQALGEALALMDRPAILADDAMEVVAINEAARRYLERTDRFSSKVDLRSCGMLPAAVEMRATQLCSGTSLNYTFSDGQGAFVFGHIVRRAPVGGRSFCAQRRVEGRPFAAYFIQLRVAGSTEPRLAEEVAAAFHLTPAEQHLLTGLLAGRSLNEIAAAKSVSYNTARNQLSSLLNKTDLHSQSDLVRFFTQLE